jgi:hypothetical protein
MKNPFQTAPRCVQWAAVILIALPVFETVVALNVMSVDRYLSQWRLLLPPVGIMLGLAAGLLFGVNLVRLLFAGLVLCLAATEVFAWYYLGFNTMSLVSALVPRVVPFIALGLCFLPPANRYFAGKSAPAAAPDVPRAAAKTGNGTVPKLLLVAAVLVVGLFLVKQFTPALEDASVMSRDQKDALARITEGAQDTQIGQNLRLLLTASSQYAMEHPGATPRYADLVGPNRFLTQLPPVVGEKYPDAYPPGVDPVAVLPDGSVVSCHRETFRTIRLRPASARRAK